MGFRPEGGPQEEFGEGASQLALRDRMNHAFLLAMGILLFQKTTTNTQNLEGAVRETVMALFDIIPEIWHDEDFIKDVQAARSEQIVDCRPEFCGVKASVEWCEANGVAPFQKTAVYNSHLLMKGCVNLLERRGLMSRKIFKEIFTGKRFKGKQKDVGQILEEMLQETGTGTI